MVTMVVMKGLQGHWCQIRSWLKSAPQIYTGKNNENVNLFVVVAGSKSDGNRGCLKGTAGSLLQGLWHWYHDPASLVERAVI
jgi:hypothetical protein